MHANCDNRGKMYFVATTNYGKVIGGYRSLAWDGNVYNYRFDANAFLFSITNDFKHTQTGFYASYNLYSVYDGPYYGPTFGAGHDFYTDGSYSYVNLGYTYSCRVGSMTDSTCINDFVGDYNFSLTELEIFVEN